MEEDKDMQDVEAASYERGAKNTPLGSVTGCGLRTTQEQHSRPSSIVQRRWTPESKVLP